MNKLIRTILLLFCTLLTKTHAKCSDLHQLSKSELDFMSQANEVLLYAIPPHPESADAKGVLGKYPILATARLSSEESRRILITSLVHAVELGGPMAACFDPHHAVQFRKGTEIHTFLICFDCGEAIEYINDQMEQPLHYSISTTYSAPFNCILDAADPQFRSKTKLFTSFMPSSSIESGKDLNTALLFKSDGFRDAYNSDVLGEIDFAKGPRAARWLIGGEPLKRGDVSYSKP